MTTDEHRLRQAPNAPLLFHGGKPDRLSEFERWCDDRGFRPSLFEMEQERARRRAARDGRTA